MLTKFNPENKKKLTSGQILGPAMEIADIDDAAQYFQSYIEYLLPYVIDSNKDSEPEYIYNEAVRIAKHNIGYYAVYFDNETRTRVEKVFSCSHPIFGSIASNGAPTAKQAFEMGKSLAMRKIREVKLNKINESNNN